MDINIANLLNLSVMSYLKGKPHNSRNENTSPSNFNNRNWDLNCLPEIALCLWEDFTVLLPEKEKCQWIFYGTPVLFNPSSGIIFGLAEGTLPPLLKFNVSNIEQALKKGAKQTLSNSDGIYANANEIGSNWLYCFTFLEDVSKLCYQSYIDAFGRI
jgi:hypothetical protein